MLGKLNEIFFSQIPRRPYCTNYLGKGLYIRQAVTAARHLYIQLNPPGLQWVLVFDLDYEAGRNVHLDYNLPAPTWYVGNPATEYAHLIYALKAPVCTSDAGHPAPLRYLAAIQAAMTERLKADPLYAGLIAKNPMRDDFWEVYPGDENAVYTLDTLARAVRKELKGQSKPKRERPLTCIAGLGRNCYVFDKARLWAYTAVRDYWGRHSSWEVAVGQYCEKLNTEFPDPLDVRELDTIARSIATWVWKHFSPEAFSELQRARILARWEKESRRADGLNLLRAGLTVADVAEAVDVTERAVRLWREKAGLKPLSLAESKPWEAMGISRSLYYRDYHKK